MKKRILLILMMCCIGNMITVTAYGSATTQEMRAVWMATVFNLDYPTSKNDVNAQKEEYIKKIDELKAIGINTIVVQVRPKADALYKSAINPWSDILTGTQGKDPGYDPMAFMIDEAHQRGMEFHAWLNPYRITTSGTSVAVLHETHPARLHPDWVISHNNALYYNPAVKGVKDHIVATVEEIVKNYAVDAIHFDDYFYPTDYPLPQGEEIDGAVANSRRQHVNEMIQEVSKAIKQTNKNVKFGISPSGIWKNNTADVTGSNTGGKQSYYSVYGDTRTWIRNEWIDYVVPQIYWEIGNKLADYETLVKWWSNEVKGTNVKLYIGQGIYKDNVAEEIDKQLAVNKNYNEVKGSFYYGMSNLLLSKGGCKEKIAAANQPAAPGQGVDIHYNEQGDMLKGTVTADVINVRTKDEGQYSIKKGTKVFIIRGSK